jgi:predicted HTH transcriptional regulator
LPVNQKKVAEIVQCPILVALAATDTSYSVSNHSYGGVKMSFWSKKQDEFEAMDAVIQENPGISPAGLARLFGVSRSTITRRLPSVEEAGYLYYEDDEGGLWPFKRRR